MITYARYVDESNIIITVTQDTGEISTMPSFPSNTRYDELLQTWLDAGNTIAPYISNPETDPNNYVAVAEENRDAGIALDNEDKQRPTPIIIDRPEFEAWTNANYSALDNGTEPPIPPASVYQLLAMGQKVVAQIGNFNDHSEFRIWYTPAVSLTASFVPGVYTPFIDSGLGYWVSTNTSKSTTVTLNMDTAAISPLYTVPNTDTLDLVIYFREETTGVAGEGLDIDNDGLPDTKVSDLAGGGMVTEDEDSINIDVDGSGDADIILPK